MSETDEVPANPQEVAWSNHASELLRYATLLVGPDDAPDIVAGAFHRVMAKPQGQVRDLRAYLFRAVTNAAADQHRSTRRRQVRDLHALLPEVLHEQEPMLEIRHAVADLSVQQRSVVYFTYWEDLDANQIARILSITPDSVRRHLARARVHLRKALQ